MLVSHESTACPFDLDGLDEYEDKEGKGPLLDAIRAIQKTVGCNGKICVSSRPETQFQSAIGQSLELRLHILTQADMEDFVRKRLQTFAPSRQKDPHFIFEVIQKQLVRKAQGVFLWLALALQSVVQGFENGDSTEEIDIRTEQLPNKLDELYRDMWNRLNSNKEVYKLGAGKVFAYVLAKRERLANDVQREHNRELPYHTSVLELAFALDKSPTHEIFVAEKFPLSERAIQDLYRETSHFVRLRCAGLLEIRTMSGLGSNGVYEPLQTTFTRRQQGETKEERMDRLERPFYKEDIVDFIHRTAYDYLLSTDAGRALVAASGWNHEATSLTVAKTYLAYSRIYKGYKTGFWVGFRHLCMETEGWLLFVVDAISDADATISQRSREFLSQCLELSSNSLESGVGTWQDLLLRESIFASRCLHEPRLSGLVLRQLNSQIIPVVLTGYLKLYGVISRTYPSIDSGNECKGPFLSIVEGLLQMGWTSNIQLRSQASEGSGSDYIESTTLLEALVLELFYSAPYAHDHRTCRRLADFIESIVALSPDLEDMKRVLPASRCLNDIQRQGSSGRIDSFLGLHSVYKIYAKPIHSLPAAEVDWSEECHETWAVFEGNVSYFLSEVFKSLICRGRGTDFFPLLTVLMKLQQDGVPPFAKVHYLIGSQKKEMYFGLREITSYFMYRCHFDSHGNNLLLHRIRPGEGADREELICRISQYLSSAQQSENMEALNGRLQDHVSRGSI